MPNQISSTTKTAIGFSLGALGLASVVSALFAPKFPVIKNLSSNALKGLRITVGACGGVALVTGLAALGYGLKSRSVGQSAGSSEAPSSEAATSQPTSTSPSLESSRESRVSRSTEASETDRQVAFAVLVASGDVEGVKKLLQQGGVDPNRADRAGRPPLVHAAVTGNCEMLEALLKIDGIDLQQTDKNDMTAIGHAVWKDNEEAFDLLLKAGADPNAPGHLLKLALRRSSLTYTRKLIERGANLDNEVVVEALRAKNLSKLALVVEKGAPVVHTHFIHAGGFAPFINILKKGHDKEVEQWIKSQYVDGSKRDLLAKQLQTDCILKHDLLQVYDRLAREASADQKPSRVSEPFKTGPNKPPPASSAVDPERQKELAPAVERGKPGKVEEKSAGSAKDSEVDTEEAHPASTAVDPKRQTQLTEAMGYYQAEKVERLLKEGGVDVNGLIESPDEKGKHMRLLSFALREGMEEIATLLLAQEEIDKGKDCGQSLYGHALVGGFDMILPLLDAKVDASEERSLFMLALNKKRYDLFSLFRDAGLDLDKPVSKDTNQVPLQCALTLEDRKAFDALVDAGASVDKIAPKGTPNPMAWAYKKLGLEFSKDGNVRFTPGKVDPEQQKRLEKAMDEDDEGEVMRILKEGGVDINAPLKGLRVRPLSYALLHKMKEVAAFLLARKGIDTGEDGSQSLYFYADCSSGIDMVHLLLTNKIDASREDYLFAKVLGERRFELIPLFRDAGMDLNRHNSSLHGTPLGHAARLKDHDAYNALVKAGASASSSASEGISGGAFLGF